MNSKCNTTIHLGDACETLMGLPDESFHGCLSDPPYGINFMGYAWDRGVPSTLVWSEVRRVLKPGAYLLAFGGTRMAHRLTCAIEDAGFEVRDSVARFFDEDVAVQNFLYSLSNEQRKNFDRAFASAPCAQWMFFNGFPKSLDVGAEVAKAAGKKAAKRFAGLGTSLKPAFEPIIVARKPLSKTVAKNVLEHGCGALAIDASRVMGPPSVGGKTADGLGYNGGKAVRRSVDRALAKGRWPSNVILDHASAALLDTQSGNRKGMSGGGKHRPGSPGGMFGAIDCEHTARGDSGGASRFFYCPKPSREERDAGLEAFESASSGEATHREDDSPGTRSPRAGAGRSGGSKNIHPTVKPIDLARYLARLILPPVADSRLLVPFSGSGTEMIGAMQAGWSHVEGIDSWGAAVNIAEARLAHWKTRRVPTERIAPKAKKGPVKDPRQTSLFALVDTLPAPPLSATDIPDEAAQ